MAPYSISHSTLCNTHLFNSNIPRFDSLTASSPSSFRRSFRHCDCRHFLQSTCLAIQSNPKIQTKAKRIEFQLAVSEKCEWTMLKKTNPSLIKRCEGGTWERKEERGREILPEIDEEHDKRVFHRIRDYELNLQQKVIRFKKHIHEWYESNQQPRVVFHVRFHCRHRQTRRAAIQFFIVLSPETEMKTNKCAPNS